MLFNCNPRGTPNRCGMGEARTDSAVCIGYNTVFFIISFNVTKQYNNVLQIGVHVLEDYVNGLHILLCFLHVRYMAFNEPSMHAVLLKNTVQRTLA